MAADMLYGGAAYWIAYRLKDTGSAYEIVQADGTTAATTTAHASVICNGYIEESNHAKNSDGSMKSTINQYDVNEDIIDFLNTFAKKPATSAGTAPAGIIMEHGVTQGGGAGAGSQPNIVWISAGPVSTDAPTKRLAMIGVGTVDMASGPIVFKNGNWIKPDIIVNSIGALYAVSLIVGLFPAALFGAVGTVAIPQYTHYTQSYLLKA